MKADRLASELLNYTDDDGYCDVYAKDNKLLVEFGGTNYDIILLEGREYRTGQGMTEKDLIGKILELAKYYGSDSANTGRDLNNFSAEIIELIKGSDE